MAKVQEHVGDATSKGAEIALGGKATRWGLYYEPTILTNVTSDMLVTNETFGPVAPLFKFDKESEPVTAANDTDFGLASYFYSRDLARVWRVSEALDFGMVGVNTGLISTAEAPFKWKGSWRAWARRVSLWLEDFMEAKYVCMGRSLRNCRSPPELGEDMAAIIGDFERIVTPGMTHWQHPRFSPISRKRSAPRCWPKCW